MTMNLCPSVSNVIYGRKHKVMLRSCVGRCVISVILCFCVSTAVILVFGDGRGDLKPSEWCRIAMERVQEVPVYMRSLMIYLCSRQAGETKTYRDVGVCMDAVKALCYKELSNFEPVDTM